MAKQLGERTQTLAQLLLLRSNQQLVLFKLLLETRGTALLSRPLVLSALQRGSLIGFILSKTDYTRSIFRGGTRLTLLDQIQQLVEVLGGNLLRRRGGRCER